MAEKEHITFKLLCNNCGAVVVDLDSNDTEKCPRCGAKVDFNEMKEICSKCYGLVGQCEHTRDGS